MAVDERTVAVQAWALREAVQVEQLKKRTQSATWRFWRLLRRWYDRDSVAAAAAQSAALAEQSRLVAGNLGVGYMREVIGGTTGVQPGPVSLRLPPARLGADLTEVYARPAEAYRREFSVTGDGERATAAARARLDQLIETDLLVARRDGEHQALIDGTRSTSRALRITGYRRIIHPERSMGGVCGLCLAASDRIYSIGELLPVHERCKCTIASITSEYDPGEANVVDLEAVYTAAGGTTAGAELKRTRWQVDEHGELGPVLTRVGDRFRRKGDAPKGDPVERARKELLALEPVLADLEARSAGGDSSVGPALEYQRARVRKLRRIVGRPNA